MKTLLKRLFSDSFSFAVATMGNKIVALLLVAVWTKNLTQTDYAVWGLTNTFTLILTYISMLGTDTAMAFYFFDSKDTKDRRIYFFNAVFFSTVMCLIYAIIAYLTGAPMSEFLYRDDKGQYATLLFIATLATIGAIIIQHVLGYARYSRRVWLFNGFSMAYVIGSNLISVLFVIQKKGVYGLFYGQLIGQFAVALVLLIIFRKEFVLKFSRKHLTDLISYGLPLLPTLVSFWVITSVSRPILVHLSSDVASQAISNSAIFDAAVRVASFIVLITAPFQLAWRPFSMSIKEREDAPHVFGIVGRILLVVGTLFIMILTFFMGYLFPLLIKGAGYYEGYLYVWLLSIGTLFNVLHVVFGVGLLIKKETKKISQAFLVASIVYLIGCLILVPYIKIWGAVSMTAVSYLLVIILVYIQNQKTYPVDFRFNSMLIYISIYLACMIGITWVQVNNIQDPWMYYTLALIITIVAVFATKLISVKSLNRIGSFLPKLGGKR